MLSYSLTYGGEYGSLLLMVRSGLKKKRKRARMSTLEDTRRIDGAKLDIEGRYYVQVSKGYRSYGYRAHFSGAYVCYTCGHLCDCGDE